MSRLSSWSSSAASDRYSLPYPPSLSVVWVVEEVLEVKEREIVSDWTALRNSLRRGEQLKLTLTSTLSNLPTLQSSNSSLVGVSEERNLSLLSFPPLFFIRTDPHSPIIHLAPRPPQLPNPHQRSNKAKKGCKSFKALSLLFTSHLPLLHSPNFYPTPYKLVPPPSSPIPHTWIKNEFHLHFPSWSHPFLSPISISLLRPPSPLFISAEVDLPSLLFVETHSDQKGQERTKDRSRMDRNREEHFHSLRKRISPSSFLTTSYRGGSILRRGWSEDEWEGEEEAGQVGKETKGIDRGGQEDEWGVEVVRDLGGMRLSCFVGSIFVPC